jgi:DNA-binding MarR family transcriptional regulator
MKTSALLSKTPAVAASTCNGAALRKAARRLSQLYDDVLAPCGLRLSQHSVLVHIDRAGSPTMSDLAKDMVLDRSALSHNLKPLERDGFVKLMADDTDKRSRRAALTAAGIKKLSESKALWAVAQKRFERAYGADKACRLRALLAEICSDDFQEVFNRD